MPMTGDGLFAAVINALGTAQDPALQEAALKPICRAIVEYVTANAQVTVSAGIPVATTGSPTAQTGATTATGTGTIS